MSNANILIVDDELIVCESCVDILNKGGYSVTYTLNGKDALKIIESGHFDVVITDLRMVEIDGMELLKKIKSEHPEIIVIIITGYATIPSTVEAIKSGAFNYLAKPFTPQEMLSAVEEALNKKCVSRLDLEQYQFLSEKSYSEFHFDGVIGNSPLMKNVFNIVMKVAPTDSPVLILGESGTGKELIAKAIHKNSKRKDNNFVAVDSGTLSDSLLESELFGHIKGSFTGAVATKIGLLETADKGTMFFDEIGNLNLNVQGKLLRVLQEQEFLPVGGTTPKKVDVRFVFATNKDLKTMVSHGTFREDLYYRINVIPISIPPLRERKEDIPILVNYFLEKCNNKIGKKIEKISDSAMELILNYDWVGNVRQLENFIERLVILVDDNIITESHLPTIVQKVKVEQKPHIPKNSRELKKLKKEIKNESIKDIEKAFVIEALNRNGWNVTKSAKDVGMQRPNFQFLMRKHKVKLPNKI